MQTKDFKGQDLRGRSFKNQDLTGADFSDCDLRGVDFSYSNLTDAKFCNARMGSSRKLKFVIGLIQYSLVMVSGFIALMGNYWFWAFFEGSIITSDKQISIIVTAFSLLFFVIAIFATAHKKFNYFIWFFGLVLIFMMTINLMKSNFNFIEIVTAVANPFFGTGVLVIAIAIATIGTAIIAGMDKISDNAVLLITAFFGFLILSSMPGENIKTIVQISCSLIYIAFGVYLGMRTIKIEEFNFLFIRNFSLKLACIGSTRFYDSTLKAVDFSSVDLKQVNFKKALISNCNFKNTKNHHLALFENTPLEPRKVRDLVIDGIITDKNFATLDLRGLDFSHLNLQDFDFSHANLSGANLSHTQLTDATLEGWNIDTETRLDDIDCRYYYFEKVKDDDTEEEKNKKRMPPKGEEYPPGEFTRIFQKIASTIDFIAHNEMELAAIKLSVEQVRVESGNDDIRVQAIEEKDGFIVVKVTVPKTEDRGVLYHEVNVLKQDYEAKIQGLMAEKHIQIGKIEVLKEQLKEQREDFLASLKQQNLIQIEHNTGEIIMNDKNISTNITGTTVHGSVVTAEKIDHSRHQSFDGTASNANINFGDNATLTNTVQPVDNQEENYASH